MYNCVGHVFFMSITSPVKAVGI